MNQQVKDYIAKLPKESKEHPIPDLPPMYYARKDTLVSTSSGYGIAGNWSVNESVGCTGNVITTLLIENISAMMDMGPCGVSTLVRATIIVRP